MNKTIYILGAGFSKSANAPLQSELIDEIFKIKNDKLPSDYRQIFIQYRNDFKNFLLDTMFMDENNFGKISLEDIYTPIDRCIIDNLAFRNISPKDLIDLRQKINGLIIMMLNNKLHFTRTKGGHIENFTDYLITLRKSHKKNDPFALISTNWDILIDNSFKRKIENSEGIVDYCCYTTPYDRNEQVIPGLLALGMGLYNIKLLKLHGSMNWLHCKRCQRLFVTFFEKIAIDEYVNKPICRICERNFSNEHTSDGGALLGSQLIMPTFLKDLNNVQLKLIWQNAGIELSEASKIIFMGYSFPMADFELRQLLARNVRHNAKIDVVLHSTDKPKDNKDNLSAEYRFKSFFGKREINMFYDGVEGYIKNLKN
ncbi:MAG: hypothetical protein HOO91_18160 [Bacteroidales bacterium]|nr:hypothetical protein [Bacteroidales bacterium]